MSFDARILRKRARHQLCGVLFNVGGTEAALPLVNGPVEASQLPGRDAALMRVGFMTSEFERFSALIESARTTSHSGALTTFTPASLPVDPPDQTAEDAVAIVKALCDRWFSGRLTIRRKRDVKHSAASRSSHVQPFRKSSSVEVE